MPDSFHQVVDSISEEPTVLFDLDVEPWQVAEFDWAPPKRRRSVSSSMLVDGGYEASSVLEDREVTITLQSTHGAAAEEQAASLSALLRLVSRPAILKHQMPGMSQPVFFLTRPVDPSIVERLADAKPDRDVVLVLPADPAAYGLPVEGTVTVRADVGGSDGTIGFFLDDVLGDLPTRLRIRDTTVGNSPIVAAVAAAETMNGFGTAAIPTQALVTSGWSTEVVSSGIYFGGTALRISRDTVSGSADATEVLSGVPGNTLGPLARIQHGVPGDYRIFIRARNSVPGFKVDVKPDLGPDRWVSVQPGLSSFQWLEAGIVRMPSARRAGTPLEPYSLPAYTDLDVRVTSPGTGGYIDLDAIVAVPAGFDDGHCTLALSDQAPIAGSVTLTLDDQWTTGNLGRTVAFGGALPTVVPGRRNVVHYFAVLDTAGTGHPVTWKYYPRYLYLRAAGA